MSEKRKKKALISIFTIIFLDITGFGMIIPLSPILARDFGAEGLTIGLLISSYSVMQFLFSPFWGRLSDIFGRRFIIIFGLFGSALAHLLFAFSDTIADLFLSRVLAGFFGGNVAIATAYIADVTSEKNRSKNLGLIGMAFGLGFTIGPIIGFLFILFGEKLGTAPPYGANFAAIGAVILCIFNLALASVILKESLAFRKHFSEIFNKQSSYLFKRPSFYMVWESLKTPKLGVVLVMSFLLWFALAQIEPVLILLIQDDFEWSRKTAYSSFIYIGLLMVFSQAYLVRKWIPQWGEAFVNQSGLLIISGGLMLIALSGILISPESAFFSPAFFVLFFGVTLFSIGYSLSNTCLNGALSLMSSDRKQGSIFGVNQSLSAMARIIGPATGGWFYQSFRHESPFLFGSFLTLSALTLALVYRKNFPKAGWIQKK